MTMRERLIPLVPRLLSFANPAPCPSNSIRWGCQQVRGLRTNHFTKNEPPLRPGRPVTTSSRRLNVEHEIRPSDEIDGQTTFKQQVFDHSIALSRSRMNDSTELRCALLNAGSLNPGVFKTTRLTKAEIAQQYGVDGRELRNADLRSEGIPHILVRPSTIFLSIFTLRLLIQSDRVLVFLVESEGDEDGAKTQDVFEHNLQSRIQVDQGSGFTPSLPFELRVVDAALASVTAILEAKHFILQGEVEKRLPESRREESVHLALRELLEHAKRLNTVEQHARQVRSALAELLNNDEDLALMYLSDRKAGKPHAIEDHQEVEYLLEAYYKNADAIAESASSLIGEVYRTARVTQSVLDVRRNQIMIFEAQLEIWMLGLAVSTFVAGLIGMNVINYMEETPYAFAWLVGGCMVTTLFISRLGMRKLRQFRKMHL